MALKYMIEFTKIDGIVCNYLFNEDGFRISEVNHSLVLKAYRTYKDYLVLMYRNTMDSNWKSVTFFERLEPDGGFVLTMRWSNA